ncbi:hypothetical protein RA27_16400 [Ruegeria sp. ANG-R]|uniref:hypothetical protein n=1 Tax=Ruegeria sp. ANG-R TaxID=1577903 RepID=UPI00057CE5ED|nr:hypothetical protein [Ruegeria sp. ANG-R]KIC39884.1 hypothetical protein RA27_16400 [Ruegeria sp. ANG-R]
MKNKIPSEFWDELRDAVTVLIPDFQSAAQALCTNESTGDVLARAEPGRPFLDEEWDILLSGVSMDAAVGYAEPIMTNRPPMDLAVVALAWKVKTGHYSDVSAPAAVQYLHDVVEPRCVYGDTEKLSVSFRQQIRAQRSRSVSTVCDALLDYASDETRFKRDAARLRQAWEDAELEYGQDDVQKSFQVFRLKHAFFEGQHSWVDSICRLSDRIDVLDRSELRAALLAESESRRRFQILIGGLIDT